ncbi:hypothetical protein IAT38_002706 [Cryptococcus sp. DSM 104549]
MLSIFFVLLNGAAWFAPEPAPQLAGALQQSTLNSSASASLFPGVPPDSVFFPGASLLPAAVNRSSCDESERETALAYFAAPMVWETCSPRSTPVLDSPPPSPVSHLSATVPESSAAPTPSVLPAIVVDEVPVEEPLDVEQEEGSTDKDSTFVPMLTELSAEVTDVHWFEVLARDINIVLDEFEDELAEWLGMGNGEGWKLAKRLVLAAGIVSLAVWVGNTVLDEALRPLAWAIVVVLAMAVWCVSITAYVLVSSPWAAFYCGKALVDMSLRIWSAVAKAATEAVHDARVAVRGWWDGKVEAWANERLENPGFRRRMLVRAVRVEEVEEKGEVEEVESWAIGELFADSLGEAQEATHLAPSTPVRSANPRASAPPTPATSGTSASQAGSELVASAGAGAAAGEDQVGEHPALAPTPATATTPSATATPPASPAAAPTATATPAATPGTPVQESGGPTPAPATGSTLGESIPDKVFGNDSGNDVAGESGDGVRQEGGQEGEFAVLGGHTSWQSDNGDILELAKPSSPASSPGGSIKDDDGGRGREHLQEAVATPTEPSEVAKPLLASDQGDKDVLAQPQAASPSTSGDEPASLAETPIADPGAKAVLAHAERVPESATKDDARDVGESSEGVVGTETESGDGMVELARLTELVLRPAVSPSQQPAAYNDETAAPVTADAEAHEDIARPVPAVVPAETEAEIDETATEVGGEAAYTGPTIDSDTANVDAVNHATAAEPAAEPTAEAPAETTANVAKAATTTAETATPEPAPVAATSSSAVPTVAATSSSAVPPVAAASGPAQGTAGPVGHMARGHGTSEKKLAYKNKLREAQREKKRQLKLEQALAAGGMDVERATDGAENGGAGGEASSSTRSANVPPVGSADTGANSPGVTGTSDSASSSTSSAATQAGAPALLDSASPHPVSDSVSVGGSSVGTAAIVTPTAEPQQAMQPAQPTAYVPTAARVLDWAADDEVWELEGAFQEQQWLDVGKGGKLAPKAATPADALAHASPGEAVPNSDGTTEPRAENNAAPGEDAKAETSSRTKPTASPATPSRASTRAAPTSEAKGKQGGINSANIFAVLFEDGEEDAEEDDGEEVEVEVEGAGGADEGAEGAGVIGAGGAGEAEDAGEWVQVGGKRR